MGNFLDKLFNGPPFGPYCVPECTDAPRGSRCYKGECVPECPLYSKFENGKCVCQSGLDYSSVNIPNKTMYDGWGTMYWRDKNAIRRRFKRKRFDISRKL